MTLKNDWDWRDNVDELRLDAVDTLREVARKAVHGEATRLEVKDLERIENGIHEVRRDLEEDLGM